MNQGITITRKRKTSAERRAARHEKYMGNYKRQELYVPYPVEAEKIDSNKKTIKASVEVVADSAIQANYDDMGVVGSFRAAIVASGITPPPIKSKGYETF